MNNWGEQGRTNREIERAKWWGETRLKFEVQTLFFYGEREGTKEREIKKEKKRERERERERDKERRERER